VAARIQEDFLSEYGQFSIQFGMISCWKR